MKFIKSILLATIFTSLLPLPLDAAADFSIDTQYTIEYTEDNDYVTVRERVEISVNNSKYFLPAGEGQPFEIPDFDTIDSDTERQYKLDSLSIKDLYGSKIPYQYEEHDNGITLTIEQKSNATTSRPFVFEVLYKTHELINLNGNITNIYIPGLPEDTSFTHQSGGLSTSYSYTTKLIANTTEKVSYIQPEDIKPKKSRDTLELDIPQNKRLGNSAWIQLGTSQYYHFKIIQETPKTDNLTPGDLNKITDFVSTNVYALPIPRDYDETNQRVYIKSMSPKPTTVSTDYEGNLQAFFEVPANKESVIEVEGYIALTNELNTEYPNYSLEEYHELISENNVLDRYTQPDIYWESDNDAITQIADDIKKEVEEGNNQILDLIKADYQYVIDLLDYSPEKVTSDNTRIGALEALAGEPAVCMEYSDLTVALLRAQGIPARAAVGYGNDPSGFENAIGRDELTIQQIGHQWVQVWIPKFGWYSLDPTWGEYGRTYLGTNLDHLLWYTLGSSEQEAYGGTTLNSADTIRDGQFQVYEVYLQSLSYEQYTGISDIETISSYLSQFETTQYSPITKFMKTTAIGRALVVTLPIVVLVTVLTMISTIFSIIKKRRDYKKKLLVR